LGGVESGAVCGGIEKDGKTEEELAEEILGLNEELDKLNQQAQKLVLKIHQNVLLLAGES
jgi:hypothetical protein